MADAQSCEVVVTLYSVDPYAYGWLLQLLLVTVIIIYWLLLYDHCWLVRFLCYCGNWVAMVTAFRKESECCACTHDLITSVSLCSREVGSEGSVRTSQETHYISITKPNRLMLFREIIAVYCENHTEHKCTVWAECRVQFAPHRKHITSPIQSPTG
jgi:hypothetical protein